jgi:hypothetical protein
MQKIFYTILLFLGLNGIADAQNACLKTREPHMRLFGDSWMHFPAIYQAYDSALAKYGFADYYTLSTGTALISMTAETWWQFPLTRNAMESSFRSDIGKPIDIVMVSLGGNDVAFGIRKNDSLGVLQPKLNKAKLFMDSIFNFIHTTLPDAQIIWQSYDYPNFTDPCLDYPFNPYCDLWDGRGNPTPFEINRFMNFMINYMDSSMQSYNNPQFHFFNALGLMQWAYGQTAPLRYEPFGTYAPRTAPVPGGFLNYPSPQVSMGLGGNDTYHLGPHSYTVLADFYMRKFISNYLRRKRDTSFYSSGGTADGWVSSSGQTGTGEIQVANNGITQTKGIISFNTSSIPDDKVIKKASLFIRNKFIATPYPYNAYFPENFKLDIKQGTFGSTEPEAGDFSESPSLSNIACVAGTLRGSEYTLRFDLDPQALSYINKSGITQFRLDITDNNVIKFYNGDTLELESPYLDIYYDTTSIISSVKHNQNSASTIQVFPNPAVNEISLKPDMKWFNQPTTITIYSTQGSVVWSSGYELLTDRDLRIDISKIAAGSYIISMENTQHKNVGMFIKVNE